MTDWHDIDALRRHVLSFLEPREVLRLSVLNRAFRIAAGYMEDIRLLHSTPLNTNFHHIATFFHATRNLELERCYLPLESLQFLREFACLQRIVLQDVVFLQDQHLTMLTRTAKRLTHLTVSSCHLLSYVELIDAHALVHATFHRNLNLRQLQYSCTAPSVLTELRVTCSAMFQHADALVQSIPSLTHASFTECGMLSQFILTCMHPSLVSLDLDRCSVLLVVDILAPHLNRLNVDASHQLTHLGIKSEALRKLEVNVMLHLQSLALECPALRKLNIIGSSRLAPSGLRLHCPQLKQFNVHSASSIQVEDYLNR